MHRLVLPLLALLATLAGCAPEPDAEPAAAAEDEAAQEVREPRLSVELEHVPALQPGLSDEVILRFRNDGNAPGYLLRCPDGCAMMGHMPMHTWTGDGPGGAKIRRQGGCGSSLEVFSRRKSMDDCVWELKPGEVSERFLSSSFLIIPVAGVYRVSFEYVYEPRSNELPPPAKAWRGRMKAAPVEVWLNKQG